MRRDVMNKLISWKENPGRKPLIIRGARQVGKTWLAKEFGKTMYEKMAYVNFEDSKALQVLFQADFDIHRIITALQIETGVQIEAENTLIILDEIQEAEGGITSLKYFNEKAPQYHVIAAGSLLGIALHTTRSFPVGKVDFMTLYPLNFEEFVLAMNEAPLLELLKKNDTQLIKTFRKKYINLLRHYYYVGGMPEVVSAFRNNNNFDEVRTLQKQILTAYEQDLSKYAPLDIVPRLRMLWNSIPAQLSKENKKFIYSLIRKGARAKDYEHALSWLVDYGLVYKVKRVSKPSMPLKAYADDSAFKLFVLDVGLLTAMGDIDVRTLLDGNAIFEEFKGALTEQYVLQQLMCNHADTLFYWSAEGSTGEIDFLMQYRGYVIPIEVKAEENLQAKSLRNYVSKFNPKIAVRTSMSDYREEDWLVNVPLYMVSNYFLEALKRKKDLEVD